MQVPFSKAQRYEIEQWALEIAHGWNWLEIECVWALAKPELGEFWWVKLWKIVNSGKEIKF